MNPPKDAPRVFISYSQDSPGHMDRVLELSNRLRADGVDCHIDQYEPSPTEGWLQWMRNQIDAAEFVLVVCTQKYRLRFEGEEEPGLGLGVNREGSIIDQRIYEAGGRNDKFLPVIFLPDDSVHIPETLRAWTHYQLGEERGYEQLYRRITNQPKTIARDLGARRAMPPRERKQGFSKNLAPWNVPYRRNPFFTGRDQVLKELHNTLTNGSTAALTQAQAISGLGGIGKTQTAVEYAYRYRDEYKALFWIRAESESMNFREVEQTSPASSDLLRFSAFLDPDSIPLILISKSREELGPRLSAELAGAEEDPLILDNLLQPLTRYSLVRRNVDSESYSVHRMVQEVIKGEMNERERRALSERAVLALNAHDH